LARHCALQGIDDDLLLNTRRNNPCVGACAQNIAECRGGGIWGSKIGAVMEEVISGLSALQH